MERPGPPASLLLVAIALALALVHSDEIRVRAESALDRGMPARESALARGFVLGEDERIDAATAEDFRRAGLSHLLAVSGQNVALLALLAMPLLAALGMPLRTRLLWVLGLIALYVPLAGAGPSIQRAGIMGGLSVLATLSGRRLSRLYALAFAAVVLLALEPGIAADIGWQLSFAAVLGILLLAGPLRAAIAARIGSRGWRRELAGGMAMTIAATLATAPLIAFHFEEVSTTALFANLLALPAVAPAMWLGMLCAAAGQVPGAPVAALNALNALDAPLLAYIAQVAAWCGRPSWASLHVRLDLIGLVAAYAGLIGGTALAFGLSRHRRLRSLRATAPPPSPRQRRRGLVRIAVQTSTASRAVVFLTILAVLAELASGVGGEPRADGSPAPGLRISVLDVGQGDAILLQPRAAPAVLVDGGPPGGGIVAELRAAGVGRLGAAIVTHDQSDHAGGIRELLGELPVDRVLFAVLRRSTLARIHAAGVATDRLAQGSELRSGALRLDVLWPPRELLAVPHGGEDPNALAVVALARWHDFSMLLTADAEAETTPLDPGPVDVLKVAHHGSEDAGLAALLDRTRPRLAVISVGADNPFGHPTPGTLATLAAHGVPTLRTDLDGTVVIDVTRRGFGLNGSPNRFWDYSPQGLAGSRGATD
ncbi:MAG TPA: ComEC/Rec2 family competence protein [Solirubrobacterales bacterium]|nr:ComEC/Rec2 family competence protein [Solirubrobacterales bacterium]